MTEYTTADILDYSALQQPLKVADAFDSVLRAKIEAQMDDFRTNFEQSVFATAEEPEFDPQEDDLDLDDVDLDDIDLDDDDDLDLDDDLDDLEDLDIDLDEDDTDEDA